MSFVLVHFPTAYSKPVGIWWWDRGQDCPRSYYVPSASSYHDIVMDQLGKGKNQTHWEGVAQKLSDRTPTSDAFQADLVSVSPPVYLKHLRAGTK